MLLLSTIQPYVDNQSLSHDDAKTLTDLLCDVLHENDLIGSICHELKESERARFVRHVTRSIKNTQTFQQLALHNSLLDRVIPEIVNTTTTLLLNPRIQALILDYIARTGVEFPDLTSTVMCALCDEDFMRLIGDDAMGLTVTIEQLFEEISPQAVYALSDAGVRTLIRDDRASMHDILALPSFEAAGKICDIQTQVLIYNHIVTIGQAITSTEDDMIRLHNFLSHPAFFSPSVNRVDVGPAYTASSSSVV